MRRDLAGLVCFALAACGATETPGDQVARAKRALDEGLPKRALSEVENATRGPGLIVRVQAMLELDEWATFGLLERNVPAGPEKAALACLFAAKRRDVDAEKKCRVGFDVAALDGTLADATQRALGQVLETEHRPDEAELQLRHLADAHPTGANRKAVVAFLEGQGFVREAVAFLESWLAATPGDSSLELKLARTLERKLRGDLLEKRGEEAEAAARRILVLDPKRAQVRYFLADALDLRGDKTGAEAERAAAKAAGAVPPAPVDALPGSEPPPAGRP